MEVLKKGDFSYRLINSENEAAAIDVIVRAMHDREPIISYTNAPREATTELFRNVLDQYKARELSVVCIHEPTQTVCGAFLCAKMNPDIVDTYSENVLREYGYVFKLLESLDAPLIEKYGNRLAEGLHQFMLGVDGDWLKHGVGLDLGLITVELGRTHGCTFAMAELSNPISQHMCIDKYQYEVLNIIEYKNFLIDGIKPFENLEGNIKSVFKEI